MNLAEINSYGINPEIPGDHISHMAQQVPPHPWFSENSIHVAGFTPKIINISSYVLNQSEISILAKGKKFTPTPEYSDLLGLKVDIMEFIRKIHYANFLGEMIFPWGELAKTV